MLEGSGQAFRRYHTVFIGVETAGKDKRVHFPILFSPENALMERHEVQRNLHKNFGVHFRDLSSSSMNFPYFTSF